MSDSNNRALIMEDKAMIQLRLPKKSKTAQHDRRSRLRASNPARLKTTVAIVPLTSTLSAMVQSTQRGIHARIAFRLPIILANAIVAKGWRTASTWFQTAGVQDDWDCFYGTLSSVGKSVASIATPLLNTERIELA